ncbi:hypothetical protein Tco_0686433 [Tanacetum coccineum]
MKELALYQGFLIDDGDDDDDGNDGNDDDDDDANDDDNQEGDDTNDDDEETDSDRTESDRIKIPVLNQSTTEYYEEEEEKINDEETMDDEEDDEVTKELYDDVNSGFEQVKEDAHVTLTPVLDTQKADEPVQSSSVSSDFTSKLLNLENPSPADNEIASLMETSARHATAVPEITSGFTTTIPPPPSFFNPLPQQATPTPTPTTSEATTSFPSLLDFSSVFKFNDRVTNLEKDLSEIKQVDQYAQALSSIPAILDCYINNKLGEAINKAIQAHNLDCRQEAHNEKIDYIELVDTSIRAIIKKEVNTQQSSDATVLARSSLQPKSTYEAAASLSEFELTKICLDKMEEIFTLKRSRDDNDKDRDPFARSDRGTKRRKSRKEAESSQDSRSKEKKSSRTSKDASQSQHKSSGKSAHAEEPIHIVDDLGVQQDQEFNISNNDEQPSNKEVSKDDCQVDRAKEPRTSFDELMDTSFDFSTFILNRLNIKDLTLKILVGPAFELLKGTCKSLTELEYHLEECSKATTERLDWHNPEGKPHLEEIEVRREDQKLYKFREGDFPRLCLQDIVDMLFLLVQKKLTNLIIDERGNGVSIDKQGLRLWFSIIDKQLYVEEVDVNLGDVSLVEENTGMTSGCWNGLYDFVILCPILFQGKVPTEMELVLEQTQQGTSYEVSVSAEGVEELKRKVKIKGEKKEALLTLRQKPEEIEVHREDQKLYKFREGDFPRLRLQDIEDMLLLLVQKKLTNLIIDERYDLNVALSMFTRRIIIQKRMEDL